MLRFENRVGLLDLRSDKFLSTLVQIGGYCTIGQAKRLGLANSDTRALAHLRVGLQHAERVRAADDRGRRSESLLPQIGMSSSSEYWTAAWIDK